jgi:hypothetical protein
VERSSRRGLVGRAVAALSGRPVSLPASVLARYPELSAARWRVGGLPPRVGGWFLLRRTVAGITFGRTVWLARDSGLHPALLLHEVCHVRQFGRGRTFPLQYAWESIRRGYSKNRFEVEADAFAREVLVERPADGRVSCV